MTAENAVPETRYAECDRLSIAYQVFGSGVQDLVVVPGFINNIDFLWFWRITSRRRSIWNCRAKTTPAGSATRTRSSMP